MVDWNAVLEWIKTNYLLILIVSFALIVLIVIISLIKKKGKKPKQNISMEIYTKRQELRELDALLGELEGYFKKVETRMVRK